MSDQNTNCEEETIVHQFVKVQAQVTVTPYVKHGKPKVYCIDAEFHPYCDCDAYRQNYYQARTEWERLGNKCTFTVAQVLCIEIPIAFDVDVDVNEGIICCGRPGLGPCIPPCKEPDCDDQI